MFLFNACIAHYKCQILTGFVFCLQSLSLLKYNTFLLTGIKCIFLPYSHFLFCNHTCISPLVIRTVERDSQQTWCRDHRSRGHMTFCTGTSHSGPEWQQSAPKFSLASENILTYFARI